MIGRVFLDYENATEIIRLMDAGCSDEPIYSVSFTGEVSVVIKLEGGSDEDVEALKDERIEDESINDLEKAR